MRVEGLEFAGAKIVQGRCECDVDSTHRAIDFSHKGGGTGCFWVAMCFLPLRGKSNKCQEQIGQCFLYETASRNTLT